MRLLGGLNAPFPHQVFDALLRQGLPPLLDPLQPLFLPLQLPLILLECLRLTLIMNGREQAGNATKRRSNRCGYGWWTWVVGRKIISGEETIRAVTLSGNVHPSQEHVFPYRYGTVTV